MTRVYRHTWNASRRTCGIDVDDTQFVAHRKPAGTLRCFPLSRNFAERERFETRMQLHSESFELGAPDLYVAQQGMRVQHLRHHAYDLLLCSGALAPPSCKFGRGQEVVKAHQPPRRLEKVGLKYVETERSVANRPAPDDRADTRVFAAGAGRASQVASSETRGARLRNRAPESPRAVRAGSCKVRGSCCESLRTRSRVQVPQIRAARHSSLSVHSSSECSDAVQRLRRNTSRRVCIRSVGDSPLSARSCGRSSYMFASLPERITVMTFACGHRAKSAGTSVASAVAVRPKITTSGCGACSFDRSGLHPPSLSSSQSPSASMACSRIPRRSWGTSRSSTRTVSPSCGDCSRLRRAMECAKGSESDDPGLDRRAIRSRSNDSAGGRNADRSRRKRTLSTCSYRPAGYGESAFGT